MNSIIPLKVDQFMESYQVSTINILVLDKRLVVQGQSDHAFILVNLEVYY